MKRYVIFNSLLLLTIVESTGQIPVDHGEDKAKMAAIIQRARQGDANALMEADSLDPAIAIPALSAIASNRSTNAAMATTASAALEQVPNVEEHLGNQIATLSAQQTADAAFAREKAFEVLGEIHSDKAVATIAGYLFDDKTPEFNGGDFIIESNKFSALITLTEMHLSDGPTDEKSLLPYADQITLWRKWAVAKGFAPKKWHSESTPVSKSTQTGSASPAETTPAKTPQP